MNTFEQGKRYYNGGVAYEIVKRTAKTITVNAIQHAGRFNERVMDTKRVKVNNWPNREVFFFGDQTIEA